MPEGEQKEQEQEQEQRNDAGQKYALATAGYSRGYMFATSAVYCLSLFAVGSGFGARGPALTSLARQVGMIEDDGGQCMDPVVTPGPGGNSTIMSITASCSADECPESDINEMAWAQASFNIGFVACSFAAGFTMEAAGRRWHWVLSLAGATAALMMVLLTIVESPGALYAVFGVLGLCCAFPATATQAGPIWVWGEKAGPSLHLTNAMFGVGMGLAPFLVSLNKEMYCKKIWTLGSPADFHVAFIIVASIIGLIAASPLLIRSPAKKDDDGSAAEDAGGGQTLTPADTAAAPAASTHQLHRRGSSTFARPVVLWSLFFGYKFFYIMCENSLGGERTVINFSPPFLVSSLSLSFSA